jgi:hypothetical protein
MSSERRRALYVVLFNAVLVANVIYMVVDELRFVRGFEAQLSHVGVPPNRLGRDVIQIARERWFYLLCVCGLVFGAVQEVRRSRWSAVANPLVYGALLATELWYAMTPDPHESKTPLDWVLGVCVDLLLAVGLFLYRREVFQAFSNVSIRAKRLRPRSG